jgi:hypothetical protein
MTVEIYGDVPDCQDQKARQRMPLAPSQQVTAQT